MYIGMVEPRKPPRHGTAPGPGSSSATGKEHGPKQKTKHKDKHPSAKIKTVDYQGKPSDKDEKKKRKREDVSSEATTRGAVEDAEPGTVQVEAKSKRKKDKGSKKRKVDDA